MKTKIFIIISLALAVYSCNNDESSTLNHGLIAYYKLNGDVSDFIDNQNNGENNGALPIEDRYGKANKAFYFNGSGNYLEIPSLKIKDLNCYSYSVWIKPDGVPTNEGGFIYCTGSSNSNPAQSLGFQTTSTLFAGSYNQGYSPRQSYSKSNTIQPNEWLHVVVTRDSVNIKMYINAELIPISTSSSTNNQDADYGATTNAIIGGRSNFNSASYYKGSIDDLRIYNRVLDANEIKELYKL